MELTKVNLTNLFMIGGLLVTLITGWNELQNLKPVLGEVSSLKLQIETCKNRVSSLEKGEERFNETLIAINKTLTELNGTVRELKGIVDSKK